MSNWRIDFGKDIIEKYNKGIGVVNLSIEYGIKAANIRYFLRNHNQKNWRGRRVYTLEHEDYFENIDSNNKAYLLGFLCADGHVSEKSGLEGFRLEIQERDREVLEFYRKELGSDKPIKNVHKKGKDYVKLTILSTKIRRDLNKLGIRHNKTYNLTFPVIEEKYLSHFIRGFFDGDGCLYINSKDTTDCTFSIIATSAMCLKFFEIFKEKANTEGKVVRCKRCVCDVSNIFFYGNRNVQKALEYVYKEADLFLGRKRNKYFEFSKARQEHSHESKMMLSKEQVVEIRKRIEAKETLRHIAKDYGVSHGPISCIKTGRSYKDF